MAVPNIFASATSAIPLSQLDTRILLLRLRLAILLFILVTPLPVWVM
jgi:hypothetical protein